MPAVQQDYSIIILVACIVSFILQLILPVYSEVFILYPDHFFSRPWTLVTYLFLHGSLGHLFFNMLFLFFFAPELERRVGSKMFLMIYLLSGIVAGIGHLLTSENPVVGASGALFGVFACLAIIAPHIRAYIYFIPMKITHAVILFAVMDILFIGAGDMVARTAHLSGLFVGIIYGMKLKKLQLERYNWMV